MASRPGPFQLGLIAVCTLLASVTAFSAQSPAAAPSQEPGRTTAQDHQDMLDQLGITVLRPGPSGNESAPNAANTDEALANPYPDLPDPLTFDGGGQVATAEQWPRRRAEIVEHFEREVYGRVPDDVPAVAWTVAEQMNGTVAGRSVTGRQLVGRVDNSAHPAIEVNIQFTLVTPADATGPVPVMIMFRGGNVQQALGLAPPAGRGRGRGGAPPAPQGPVDPPATEQLIAAGWGFAFLNPGSIQADNGAGLTRGIIGLTNKGASRTPEQWGALRAWAWGAARALDYLETDESVDAARVGIEGVSRYGKAALVTMAFEPRFAVVLVGSAGEGGVSLMRRHFGEAVENITGSGEYHWMAGNFLKYGADAGRHGRMNASNLPVDAHSLLALAAPRPVFVSYGIPERGDAKWLDQQGSYMAAVAAGPVFRLLGARDLGTSDNYMQEKMPAVGVSLLDGQLAWRQHDGGHTDGPNWKYFIPWADRMLDRTPAPPGQRDPAEDWRTIPADRPVPRRDENSRLAHRDLLAKTKSGRIDVYFVGDSITRRWGATDYPRLLDHWREHFFGWNAANFAWGGDRTQNILWRLGNGELEGVQPKVFVVQAGANNIGTQPVDDAKVADVTRGIEAIVLACRAHSPEAVIVITGVFPRDDNPGALPGINRINQNLARLADGRTTRFIELTEALTDADGRFRPGMSVDGLHLDVGGYDVWAAALKPVLTEVLGPPAATDAAPPPTGDPSARR